VHLPLLGRFNIHNALAACSACGALGIDPELMAEVLGGMPPVPGRLERISNERGIHVFVDYAHTMDAMENALKTLRAMARRRVLVVFGCGGDRDRAKRSAMGAVAARLADYTIITSDNPRSEDPASIAADIEQGFGHCVNYEKVIDRTDAIAHAISMAERGDMLLIAGKGHETYQEFGHTVIPFDDREVVRRLI
jgi:UDP-N-acetylmuramoyl-L-alanyl-D-glutamate--2,6-diaminopimelate ligase